MIELTDEQLHAVNILRDAEFATENGMPDELFLLISSLVPIANVDMLIVNEKDQLLLARRNDEFYEKAWHIPGGCMRYGESFMHAIQETAKRELGCEVEVDETPIVVRNVIRGSNPAQQHARERGHNVAVLFRCSLPKDYPLPNGEKVETDEGFLRWFDMLPPDFMGIQHVFDDVLRPWMNEGEHVVSGNKI